jgi:hypothetical protein
MAWWQALKGVLTRSTPDWYVDRMAVAYGQGSNLASKGGCLLWNNSSPPVNFYIYAMILTTNIDKQPFEIQVVKSTLGGVLFGTPFPVYSNGATPPGQVYAFDGAPTNTGQGIAVALGAMGPQAFSLGWNFPLFVIPPNTALSVWVNDPGPATVDFFANWWFLWK